MCAFVALGLYFHTKPRDWLGERVLNDLFCVEWDVKLPLSDGSLTLLHGHVHTVRMCLRCRAVQLAVWQG